MRARTKTKNNTRPVWSVIGCEFCEILDKDLGAEPDKTGTTYGVMNPVKCPYNFVEIDGKVYPRSKKFFDALDETENAEAVKDGERCHDCGIVAGTIHHVECDAEECPRCGGQFISCGCGMNQKMRFIVARNIESAQKMVAESQKDESMLVEHIGV